MLWISLWELHSKFPSLLYSEILSKSLHYAQFYSFYAAPTIIIPLNFIFMLSLFPIYKIQFKLPSYLILHTYLAKCAHAVMHKQHNND